MPSTTTPRPKSPSAPVQSPALPVLSSVATPQTLPQQEPASRKRDSRFTAARFTAATTDVHPAPHVPDDGFLAGAEGRMHNQHCFKYPASSIWFGGVEICPPASGSEVPMIRRTHSGKIALIDVMLAVGFAATTAKQKLKDLEALEPRDRPFHMVKACFSSQVHKHSFTQFTLNTHTRARARAPHTYMWPLGCSDTMGIHIHTHTHTQMHT
jgi:hypothetical protein